ncbi:hypothetical protein [Bifidobacterium callimiconis]|uniref:Uncharacterized protein n=1 Tax=Bifidobacterium callimiconis TaxID=2306973 RepID=A0A430F879_9BIFI|nr:hypothetical protein [Bifidobacterium callimiconis]MBT1178087.1 hypothetical protein [Bifidobacterium callimiconis]RSX49001.1 hypothetical protein D2E23_2152 [Bifidobacterium callimiconis]
MTTIQKTDADFLPTWHGTIAQQGRELSLRHIAASVAYVPSANHGPATRTRTRARVGARRHLPQSADSSLS